jgi:uncharacterized membrane protein YqjE
MAHIEDRPVSAVFADIVGNVQEIIRSEVRFAKAEISKQASEAAGSASLLAGGFALAFYAFGLLLLAAVYLLSQLMPAWIAALVVCLALSAVAATLITVGRRRWKLLHPIAEKTVQTTKENLSWTNVRTK